MKVLVFGQTGQVARALALRDGVTTLNRVEADLTDAGALERHIAGTDADVIINAAAYTAVDRAETAPDLAMIINGVAPGVMARAAAARRLPFLHISTDYVFDGSGDAPWRADDPTRPQNTYGRTKLAGEEAVRAADGSHAILRTAWVFSEHGNNFVKTMLRLGKTRESLNVVEDQIGGPTPAWDIATALMVMARAMVGGQQGGTYHFAGAPHVSWAEFTRRIMDEAGLTTQIHGITSAEYPTLASRPANSRLDCANLTADFGIAPSDWQDGLSRVVAILEKGQLE